MIYPKECYEVIILAKKKTKKNYLFKRCGDDSSSVGAFYFLGMVGAAVYYVSTATSFSMGFIGLLKAIVWPAFLVFALMKSLGM